MSADKHLSEKDMQHQWFDDVDDWLPQAKSQARNIITRAAVTYGVLFLIIALILSFFGIDPLANGGLMPKLLLLFVGLAMIIALANNMVDYSREYGISWLGLARNLLRATLK